jgi:hypothetical protein
MSNGDEKIVDEESMTASEINLNSNIEARIKNPLAGIPRAQLLRNVETFAQEKELSDELPMLSKGAIRESSTISISQVHLLTRLRDSRPKPRGLRNS